MTKTQRIGPDGKMHEYWQISKTESAKTKEMHEKRKKEQEDRRRHTFQDGNAD